MDLTRHIDLKTITQIYEHYEKQREEKSHRPHLGGSQIGNTCKRALWYQFRHACSPTFPGRILRLFETGHREEDRLIKNLRAIGVKVWDRDPETGRQVSFTVHGGHFALSLDGVLENVPDAPETPHTFEAKTMNRKSFRAVVNKGVKETKPVYWAQCQVGMLLAGLDRCLFMAVEKETDKIYGERIHLDRAEAQGLIDKAGEVIKANAPPPRLSDNPAYFECKFCTYFPICHGCKIPEVNCRTCAHSSAAICDSDDGDAPWKCALHGKAGEVCQDHLFIPPIMPPDLTVHQAGNGWVEYLDADTGEVIRNQGNSADLFEGRMK